MSRFVCRDVFVIQPTAPAVNDHLMELLIFADACRRASADRIVAVVPYFGYARSDKRDGRLEPITARLTADLMQCAGIAHVILLDVHTPQMEGFFTWACRSSDRRAGVVTRARENAPS